MADTSTQAAALLAVSCRDYLKENSHLYAFKARRRKIALIELEATNTSAAEIQLLGGSAQLIAGDHRCNVEDPNVIVRKLSEFTWDFLLYSILSFHPVLLIVDLSIFLTGPLYNRRLKNQLQSLSTGEVRLQPGERKRMLLGFRGAPKAADQLQLEFCQPGAKPQTLRCRIKVDPLWHQA